MSAACHTGQIERKPSEGVRPSLNVKIASSLVNKVLAALGLYVNRHPMLGL